VRRPIWWPASTGSTLAERPDGEGLDGQGVGGWPRAGSDAPGAAGPVLELREVTKSYPGDPPVEALRGVSLAIASGALVALVGPSGSGKSTLLHVMGTLDRPTAGSVWVAGHDTTRLADRQVSGLRARAIGFVFQQFFLLDGQTALDNVANGLLYTGVSLAERRRAAQAALERVGLGYRVHHRPTQLSGGEQQRVAVARAIVGRPAIVLADEPTGNLDSVAGASIIELLLDLNRADGATIAVITHDHDLAAALPRQVWIRDGRVERDSAGVAA
jgi:putative ABC transport system ATP-binding protein